MKKQFFVTLLVALFAALTVAWAQDSTQEAAVRVVHLVPNGPNVDIHLNGQPALQDLAAGTVSGYVSLPAGQYDVEVIAAGQGLQTADETQVEQAVPGDAVATDVGTNILGGANIVGLADEAPYTVTGPEGYNEELTGDQQLVDLTPGTYTFAGDLDGQPFERQVDVVGDQVAEVNLLDDQTALTDVDTVDTAVGVDQAVTGGVAGVVGQEVQTSLAALPGLFGTIRETINAQDYQLAQDQIEEAQQNLQNLQTGIDEARNESIEAVITNLQASQEALDTPDAEMALSSLDEAEQGYGDIDTAAIESENAVAATGGAVGVAPVNTVGTGVGVDQAAVQESLQAMPALFASIRETINAQDYQLAQDQIEEAQQLVQNVGGVGTDAVLPTLELVQNQLQTAQEALDEPDPVVALASIDDAEQTFTQLEGELGDAGVVTDATAVGTVDAEADTTADTPADTAGVQEGAAIATSTITLEPGQYYTVVATQTQAALEGRVNISAQPGQAEINVTGPNGYAESFVGSRQLEALTPGNYIIAGTLVGYQSAQQQVEAQAGETLAVDLTLQPLTREQIAETPGGVTGGATDDGAQAAGFTEQPPLVQLLVFEDSLDLPPAGQALVRVVHASPDAPAVNIIAEAQQEGAMTGGVTGGAETGAMNVTFEPAGAVVNITGPDGFTQELTSSQTLEGLAPGEYVVAATLEGYQPSETRVEVAAGEVVPVDIILEATPQGSSPQGGFLVSAFFPQTAMLGLQLDQEIGGYVDRALTSLDDDVNAAQQDLRAALLAVQAQLEGATGDAQRALQATETGIQEALTALENQDAEGARQSLEALQGAQTGGATGAATGGTDASAQTGGATTGGADVSAQTGGAATGGAATATTPAQPQGSTLVSSLQTGNASDYVAVPAGTYQLQVQTADGGNVVLDIPNSTLESGVVYTFYAFGSATQGTLAVNVSVDALVAQQLR